MFHLEAEQEGAACAVCGKPALYRSRTIASTSELTRPFAAEDARCGSCGPVQMVGAEIVEMVVAEADDDQRFATTTRCT